MYISCSLLVIKIVILEFYDHGEESGSSIEDERVKKTEPQVSTECCAEHAMPARLPRDEAPIAVPKTKLG